MLKDVRRSILNSRRENDGSEVAPTHCFKFPYGCKLDASMSQSWFAGHSLQMSVKLCRNSNIERGGG